MLVMKQHTLSLFPSYGDSAKPETLGSQPPVLVLPLRKVVRTSRPVVTELARLTPARYAPTHKNAIINQNRRRSRYSVMKSSLEPYTVSKIKQSLVDEEDGIVREGTPPRPFERGTIRSALSEAVEEGEEDEDPLNLGPLESLLWGESDSESSTESSEESDCESEVVDLGYSSLTEILRDFGTPVGALDWDEEDEDYVVLLPKLPTALPMEPPHKLHPHFNLRPKVKGLSGI